MLDVCGARQFNFSQSSVQKYQTNEILNQLKGWSQSKETKTKESAQQGKEGWQNVIILTIQLALAVDGDDNMVTYWLRMKGTTAFRSSQGMEFLTAVGQRGNKHLGFSNSSFHTQIYQHHMK